MSVVLLHMLRRWIRHPPEPLRIGLLCVSVLLFGTTGFLYFELAANPQLTWTDAAWYAIVTVTTVGYGDYYPASLGGRYVVAVPLMFFGIGLLGYVLSLAAGALVQAKQREREGLQAFRGEGHLVIFNFPNTDKVIRVIEEITADRKFADGARRIVLVDEHLDLLPLELEKRGVHYVKGPPARDDTLNRCNIDQARYALILSRTPGDPSSDALTVTVALAVEARIGDVVTIAECVDGSVEELLHKAGCDGIACTSRLDAHLLSQELLDPGAGDVIAELTSNLSGQQVYITPLGGAVKSYQEVQGLCQAQGHLSIGVRRKRDVTLNPSPEHRLQEGDEVITIGPQRVASFA